MSPVASLALLGVLALLSVGSYGSAVLPPKLAASLALKQRANIVLSIEGETRPVLAQVAALKGLSRGARATAAYQALTELSDEAQKPILDFLRSARSSSFTRFRSFWISNQIVVENADWQLVHSLAALSGVRAIEEERIVIHQNAAVNGIRQGDVGKPDSTRAPMWNIRRMKAPEAWDAGFNGTGATVAVIDTGARATHVLLWDSYKGAALVPGIHAWYNPTANETHPSPTPIDPGYGYGSFNLGLATGADGYGVAPGAKWIACKAFVANAATQGDLLACGQFVACPHDYKGEKPDCTQAPDVVTNSWQSNDPDSDWFAQVVEAWRAAGVIPIFGGGNGGACRSITYPADKENVIAVAATEYNGDYVTSYSSRGPANSGGQKPQVAAPGDNVASADSYNDHNIVTFYGASQAAPHVAGLVALIRGAAPELSYDEILEVLQESANRDRASYLQQCSGKFDFVWPNYHFGHGRVDAEAAVHAVLAKRS